MILIGPIQHYSQSPLTSYYIHSLPIDLLHSSSFLFPSLFFVVSFCVIFFLPSLLILSLRVYLLIISQLSFTNKLLLLEEDYWKLTILDLLVYSYF